MQALKLAAIQPCFRSLRAGLPIQLSRGAIQVQQRSYTMASNDLKEQLATLHNYSACDVSDALLKLQKPQSGQVARAGYLADIVPFAPVSPLQGSIAQQPKVIAPASTLKLVAKGTEAASLPDTDVHAIPKGSHWVDMTDAGTIVVIEQPIGQGCAAIGGIMALAMKRRGAEGCLVGGRVRDLEELSNSSLPVWALARSTVGTGAEAKVFGRNIPVTVQGVSVNPGDIVFCDPLEGVVVIPNNLLDDLLQLMPKLVAADDRVKDEVTKGMTVYEAFKKHRG